MQRYSAPRSGSGSLVAVHRESCGSSRSTISKTIDPKAINLYIETIGVDAAGPTNEHTAPVG